jgi:hypothetical protein
VVADSELHVLGKEGFPERLDVQFLAIFGEQPAEHGILEKSCQRRVLKILGAIGVDDGVHVRWIDVDEIISGEFSALVPGWLSEYEASSSRLRRVRCKFRERYCDRRCWRGSPERSGFTAIRPDVEQVRA